MSISSCKYLLGSALVFAIFSGCKKQEVVKYTLNEQYVSSSNANKANLKSDLQLITIMHADVFGTSISSEELKALNQAYISFGDKDIVIDRITQYFLTNAGAIVPSNAAMRADIDQFIVDSYVRFYIRQPNEAEVWYLRKIIEDNTSMTPRDVYYALLTAEEYKYY